MTSFCRKSLGYLLAVVVVALALLVRWWIVQTVGEVPPFILFYPAVMRVALLVGLGPGLLATVSAGLATTHWILSPTGSVLPHTLAQAVTLGIFIAAGVLMSVVAELYRRARARAAAYHKELALRQTAEQIRRQYAELDQVYNNSPVGLFLLDCDLRFLRINRRLADILGKSVKACLGHSINEVLPGDLAGRLSERARAVLQRGESLLDEELRAAVPGSDASRYFLVGCHPFRSHKDQVIGLMGSVMDITGRKRAEQSLRESEHRYRAVVEDQTETIARLKPDGTRTFINDVYCRLFGKTREELLGKTWKPMAVAEDVPHIEEQLRSLSPANPAVLIENRVHSASGDIRWMQFVNRGLFDPDGQLREIQTVGRDITDRKLAEEALLESEERLRLHVENTPLAVIEWGPDLHISRWSAEAQRVFGWQRQEVLGKRADELRFVHEEDHAQVGSVMARMIEGLESRTVCHNRNYRKDGTVLHCQWYNSALGDASGKLRSVLSLVLDVTEHAKAQEALRESEERLRLAAVAANFGTYDYDVVTGKMHWSPELKAIWGLSPDESVSMGDDGIPSTIYSDDRPVVACALKDAIEPKGTGQLRVEHRVVRPDGFLRWVLTQGRTYFLGEGEARRAVRAIGTVLDITERKLAEEALRKSEERLKQIVYNPLVAVGIGDASGHILDVNGRLAELLGYSREELLSGTMNWRDLSPPEYAELDRQCVAELDGAGQFGPYEKENTRKDGTRVPLLVGAARLPGAAREHVAFLVDITRRKRAEKQLRENQDRLALATRAAQVGIFDCNMLTGIATWTREHEIIFGYPPSDSATSFRTHQEWADRVHPDDLPRLQESFQQSARENTHYQVEYRVIWPDGTIHWLAGQGQVYCDADGHVERILGVVIDITQRKQSEEREAASRAKLDAALRSMTDAVFISDAEGKFIEFNDAFATFHRFTSKDECSRCHTDYTEILEVSKSDGQPIPLNEWAVSRALRGETVTNTESVIRRRDTGETWVGSYSFAPIRDDHGKIMGAVVTARDITGRKRAEQEKLEMERRLLHAQKLESLGILAGGIAHDFNNILAGIMGYADLVKLRLPACEPARDDLDVIKKAVERAAGLTRQMLAYSGKGKFIAEPVNLSQVVEDTRKMLDASVSKKATVNYHLASDLPAVQADASQIHQVALNLVVNASDALGEDCGVIAVSTDAIHLTLADCAAIHGDHELREGPYVRLCVADTGCGMAPETLARIFDPFFTTKFTGRGLGLAAVHGIVRGHKGAIRVTSKPGQGTTFEVFFPAVNSSAPTSPTDSPATSWRGSGTILIVDDEPLVRNLAHRMVQQAGFSALLAADGKEAARLFRQRKDQIVCVLLDLTMPKMDGAETFRQLRQISSDVHVIFSSGYSKEDAAERLSGLEPAGFIQKPYHQSTLISTLRSVLDPSRPA